MVRPLGQRGPKARREWVLTLGEEPAAGEQVELLLDKWSVMDGFLNHPEEDLRFAITWPTTSASSRHILEDTDSPRVDLVVAVDGYLEIELSEAPDEATLASAIRLNSQPHAVTLQTDGFTLRSDQPLPLGDHLLEIETSLRDRAGRPLEQRFDAAFTWDGTTPALGIFKAESDTTPTNLLRRSRADKDLIADLTGLNLGFQGQPYDPETGLYYFRNRYYDPELGRFITADPLGYVDGPSLYAAFGNDPVNGRDPLGLRKPTSEDLAVQKALEERLFEFDWAFAETDRAEAVVLESGFKNVWWKPGEYEPFFRWEVQAASDLTSYRTLRGRLLRDLDTFVAAVAEADEDGEIEYFSGQYFTYTRAERAANDRAAWALAPVVVGDAIAMFGGPFAKAPPGELRMQARRPEASGPTRGQRLAERARALLTVQRPNTVAVLMSRDGRVVVGRNQGGVTNPRVQSALDAIPQNQFGGACAEANCIARALNKGVDVRGATIEVVNVRGPASTTGVHGKAKPACSVCRELLNYFGIGQ